MSLSTPTYEAAWLSKTLVGQVVVVLENGELRQVALDCTDPEKWLRTRYPNVLIASEKSKLAIESLKNYFQNNNYNSLMNWSYSSECAHTPFVKKVYDTLREIKPGETITYGQLATKAGHPGAARAVGSAMARNPIPIFVPCHRVIPASGCLGGFTGGVHLKKALLNFEGIKLAEIY